MKINMLQSTSETNIQKPEGNKKQNAKALSPESRNYNSVKVYQTTLYKTCVKSVSEAPARPTT